MIQAQIKLRVKNRQEPILSEWLLVLTRVWNWAIRKIELDARDGIFYTKMEIKKIQIIILKNDKILEEFETFLYFNKLL